jgi:hypothetical protein
MVDFRFAAHVGFSRLGRFRKPISSKPEIGENASTNRHSRQDAIHTGL